MQIVTFVKRADYDRNGQPCILVIYTRQKNGDWSSKECKVFRANMRKARTKEVISSDTEEVSIKGFITQRHVVYYKQKVKRFARTKKFCSYQVSHFGQVVPESPSFQVDQDLQENQERPWSLWRLEVLDRQVHRQIPENLSQHTSMHSSSRCTVCKLVNWS